MPFNDLWLHHFILNLKLLAGELEIQSSTSQGSFYDATMGTWGNCPRSYPGPTLRNSEPQCVQLNLFGVLIHKNQAKK